MGGFRVHILPVEYSITKGFSQEYFTNRPKRIRLYTYILADFIDIEYNKSTTKKGCLYYGV